jgi:hypothetical protein
VRAVINVDQKRREITFSANGMRPGRRSVFHVHYYRINFDGTGLVALTDGSGTHTVTFAPNYSVYVDTWSRVDMAPVTQLRRSSDGAQVLMELERASTDALLAAGWSPPEAFVAKGRDGKTDIYGVIVKPTQFRSGEDVSRDREHLCRPARRVHAQELRRLSPDAGAWPSLASSSCRWMGWARTIAPRLSTM